MYSSDLKNKCYHKKGYILETDKISKYKHIFGGESWSYLDKNPLNDKPILLFVLDLKDSKLSFLRVDGLEEIPIFSYLNSDLWYQPQIYKINPEDKSVFFTDKKNHIEYMQSDEDKIMNPIPPKCVSLREMKLSEYVTDEDSYWKNSDEFLGGDSFIRILGEPLWIQNKMFLFSMYVFCYGNRL